MLRRVDENWCEGRLNGKLGIFPVSFVEVSNVVVCEKRFDYCNLYQELIRQKATIKRPKLSISFRNRGRVYCLEFFLY